MVLSSFRLGFDGTLYRRETLDEKVFFRSGGLFHPEDEDIYPGGLSELDDLRQRLA